MNAEKSSLVHQGPSSAVELAGRGRDALGRFPQLWTVERALEKSKQFQTRKDFRVNCRSAYAYLVKKKKTHLLKFETEVKLHLVDYFDVICDIKKCTTRSELFKKYPSSYAAVFNHEKLKQIYNSHFGRGKTSKWWNNERAIAEAKKYKHRSDFSRLSSGAYEYVLRNGIEQQAFAHMERLKSDYDSVYIWVSDKIENGKYLAKVGVTSKRLGFERIKSVSRKSGIRAAAIYMMETKNALDVERKIKSKYPQAGLTGFNGCTEFISITEEELKNLTGDGNWKINDQK